MNPELKWLLTTQSPRQMDTSIIFDEILYDLIVKYKLQSIPRTIVMEYLTLLKVPKSTAYDYLADVDRVLELSSRHADDSEDEGHMLMMSVDGARLEVLPPQLLARRVASSISMIEHDASFDAHTASHDVLFAKVIF